VMATVTSPVVVGQGQQLADISETGPTHGSRSRRSYRSRLVITSVSDALEGTEEAQKRSLIQTMARMMMAMYEPHRPYAARAIIGKPIYEKGICAVRKCVE
jgi:hypothetical protein